jgi:hypothetical protein
MKVSIRSTTWLAGAVAAIWLCYASPAWAGGGGADSGSLLSSLSQLCADLLIPSCPQYPAYLTRTTPPSPVNSPATPIVVELAAWQNWNPDTVRTVDSDCFQFGTLIGEGFFYCPQIAVNATNPPANSPLSTAALPSLNALAFVSNPAPMVTLTVTQNSDPKATSSVYAVVEPGTGFLDLFVENLNDASTKHSKGQVVAAVTFPLAVLVNGTTTESSVFATLQITSTCNGAAACFSANVLVDLSGGTKPKLYSAAALGINFTSSSSPSPTYEVQIPLLVNPQTDPFYFLTSASLPQCPNGINQISGICNAFSQTNPPNGFTPKFLKNTVVGMAPSAAPQCPGAQPGATCPMTYPTTTPVPQPLSPTFGFCAYLSNNAYMSNSPDAAFFLAIGPDGTTYVSSPVNLSSAAPGSFPPPGPYPACPSS